MNNVYIIHFCMYNIVFTFVILHVYFNEHLYYSQKYNIKKQYEIYVLLYALLLMRLSRLSFQRLCVVQIEWILQERLLESRTVK